MNNKKIKGRVSIIIPCFNGEKTLTRCLDSLLDQSYKNLEIIFVNDGSTDNSGDIAKKYRAKFEEEGICFRYIFQENTGLGGAINTGLKYITGEYLCWGDVDDFWYPESIKIRKEYLDKNFQYGSVSSDAHYYEEKDFSKPIGLVSESADHLDEEDQFLNLLAGHPLFCSGCHMIRKNVFEAANPKGAIYPARHGQNVQLLMPVYYHNRHKFLAVPLYGYVVSDQSMSHKKLSRKESRKRIKEYYNVVEQTVKRINMPITEKYKYLKINKVRLLNALLDESAQNDTRILVYWYRFLIFIITAK